MVMITTVSSGMGPRKVLKLDKLQFGSHPRIKCDHDDENRKDRNFFYNDDYNKEKEEEEKYDADDDDDCNEDDDIMT